MAKKLKLTGWEILPEAGAGTYIKGIGRRISENGLEATVDDALGYPMDKAHDYAQPDDREEDEIDNKRHSFAGRFTAEAIKDKTGNIPVLSNLLGFAGSTALGLAHEIKAPNTGKYLKQPYTVGETIREGAEDAFNNMVGAAVGSLPWGMNHKTNTLNYLSNNNLLPDGYGRGDMYFKKEIPSTKQMPGQSNQSLTLKSGGKISLAENSLVIKDAPVDPASFQAYQQANSKVDPRSVQPAQGEIRQGTLNPIEDLSKRFAGEYAKMGPVMSTIGEFSGIPSLMRLPGAFKEMITKDEDESLFKRAIADPANVVLNTLGVLPLASTASEIAKLSGANKVANEAAVRVLDKVSEYKTSGKNLLGATKQYANYKPRPVEFISEMEQKRLDDLRNITTNLSEKGLNDEKSLQAILEKGKGLNDTEFNDLTGYTKESITDRFKKVQNKNTYKEEFGKYPEEVNNTEYGTIDITNRPLRLNRVQRLLQESARARQEDYRSLITDKPQFDIGYNFLDNLTGKINNKLTNKIFYNDLTPESLSKTTYPKGNVTALLPDLYAKNSPDNIARKIVKAVNQVKEAPSGQNFIGASSLSTDSDPASLRMLKVLLDKDLVDVNFHGFKNLNPSGVTQKIGDSKIVNLKEANTLINELNKHPNLKGKIPSAKWYKEDVYTPKLTITRKESGGKINSWEIID